MPKLLFAAYGGGHARLLAPVAHALKLKGYDIHVLGLTLGKSVFEQEGLFTYGLSDILKHSNYWDEIKKLGEALMLEDEQHPKISPLDSIAYFGSGIFDLIKSHGRSEAFEMYRLYGRRVFDPFHSAVEILKITKCDLLITTNAPRMEKALVKAAIHNELKSLVVVDSFATIEKAWLSQDGYADKVCVFHGAVKKLLINEGRDDKDIIVTGNPSFDVLAKVTMRSRNSGLPHVLYLSQNEGRIDNHNSSVLPDSIPLGVIETLSKGVKNNKFTAEVRFHPNQGDLIRKKAIGLIPVNFSSRLEDVISRADVVVTASSSAGIQAQLLGLPLVQIKWSIRNGLVPFDLIGPVWKAYDEEDLLLQIRLASESKKSPIDKNLGSSTDAVVTQIEELI